jgi:hypothetical protein
VDTDTGYRAVFDGELSGDGSALHGSGMNSAGDDARFSWSATRD